MLQMLSIILLHTIESVCWPFKCLQSTFSLPLHEAIASNRLQRGDQTLLFGMGAGLSFGGMVLRF